MPLLSLNPGNIIKFFTFLSPIFISSFLVLQSFVNTDMRALAYLIGSLLSYGIGMLLKLWFYNMDESGVSAFKANNPGQEPPSTMKFFQRIPIKNAWGFSPGTGSNPFSDNCSVFEGPFSSHGVSNTGMPSLNAIYHAFTIAYMSSGIANNPNPSTGGISFVILLTIIGLTNIFFRVHSYCDNWKDAFIGIVVGAAAGCGWFYAMRGFDPSIVYYGKEKKGKCVLGKQKFSCKYTNDDDDDE